MIVISLNAPAGAGKDALSEGIIEYVNTRGFRVVHVEFKELLFEVATRSAGISRKLWDALYEREYKERPCPYLQVNGKSVSPRDWMIHCSEELMKPTFGEEVFGKALVSKLTSLSEETPDGTQLVAVISDGGFIDESVPVINYAGEDNYFLFRISRIMSTPEGDILYNFEGDSRRYLYSKEFPVGSRPHEADVLNVEGDLMGTVEKICNIVEITKGVILHEK